MTLTIRNLSDEAKEALEKVKEENNIATNTKAIEHVLIKHHLIDELHVHILDLTKQNKGLLKDLKDIRKALKTLKNIL